MTETGSVKSQKLAAKSDGQFPLFDPAEFTRLAGRNMEVATRAARACFNGATKLNQEMVEFVNDRVRKDFVSAQAFMNSKNSEEAMHAQAEFVECAFRDYAEEASKMFHVAADIAKETLTSTERREG
jgi:hypothetical protein